MRLYIDQGNTAVKWRFIDDRGLVHEGREFEFNLPALTARLTAKKPAKGFAYVASVAETGRLEEVLQAIALANPYLEVVHVKVQQDFGGLTLAYDDISALGVDRWLIMLAAVQEFGGNVVVVSAGTATTFDRIGLGGVHEGGLIAPGWSVLRSAVQSSTANIDVALEGLAIKPALGRSTVQCLGQGVSLMSVSFVDGACRQFARPTDVKLICGGNGLAINAALKDAFILRSSLVLDGLQAYALLA